jgi:hypothetical protein
VEYGVLITRDSDNVAAHVVKADSDAKAFEMAKGWAASLSLAPDDDVVLAVKLLSGKLKPFARKDF